MIWIAKYIKEIAIGIVMLSLLTGGIKIYSDLKKLGQYEILLKDKEAIISSLLADKRLVDELVAERDRQLLELDKAYKEVTKDLPLDIYNEAPESLKEYFRRIK